MRKIACHLAAAMIVSMSLSAVAQPKTSHKDSSKVSIFGGYSLLHYSNGTDHQLYGSGGDGNITANANGIVISAAYNFTKVFAFVGEYGFYHASSLNYFYIGTVAPGESVTANMQTYLFGPKVSLPSHSPVKPFAQILMGAASGTIKDSYAGNTLTGPRANAFAMALGVGLDWKVNHHFSIRPAQFDYILTSFTNSHTLTETGEGRLGDGGNGRQNNFRYTAGVVYNF